MPKAIRTDLSIMGNQQIHVFAQASLFGVSVNCNKNILIQGAKVWL
jgi:DUF1009 family protein